MRIPTVVLTLCVWCLSVSAQNNYSLSFSPSSDYVEVPHSNILNLGTGDFTLEAWIKAGTTQPTYPQILSNRSNTQEGFLLGIWSTGHLYMQIAGINYQPATGSDLRDNTWHHVSAVRTGTSIAYYIDGIHEGGYTSSLDASVPTHSLLIGWDDGNSLQTAFNGLIDEVRIWNVAKDAAYLQDYLQSCIIGTENGLIGYWPFNEGAGTITTDVSTWGNHGTLKNGVAWSGDFFNLNCQTVQVPNTIYGNIFADENINCTKDGAEMGSHQFVVRVSPHNFFGITDAMGNYSVQADSGTSIIEQIIPQHLSTLINQLCPANPGYYAVLFDSLGQDTTGFDFANEIVQCPLLSVDVCSSRRRRCFRNLTMVEYCNEGYASADSVRVYVDLPEYVHLLTADAPFTLDTDSNYVFYIGTVNPGVCGTITIIDSVDCLPDILGVTQCTRAWLTPTNHCDSILALWDQSNITVKAVCDRGLAIFSIINEGDSMQGYSYYRIYADGALLQTDSFQLSAGESFVDSILTNGQTIRMEADQSPGHPGNSHPVATVEMCGKNMQGNVSIGYVTQLPSDDEDLEIEEQCFHITDSNDPNDKSVMPIGITEVHAVQPSVLLEYIIRFQNTGTDTAYNVVVVDSLSPYLDISTIQFGVSSHPYEVGMSGMGTPVVSFNFNNINLPDSSTDELNSHGFVKFKIAPVNPIDIGTVIHNFTDIYFDFNIPVRTNDAWVTISDTIVYSCQEQQTTSAEQICQGDSLLIGGIYRATPGIYVAALQSSQGCDSIVSVELNLTPVDTSIFISGETLVASAIADNYQWISCDGSVIPGETNQSFTPPLNGTYAVIVTQNGCADTSGCRKTTGVNISVIDNPEFSVYPNPAEDFLIVDFHNEATIRSEIKISDLSGKKEVVQSMLSSTTNTINIDKLTPGTYIAMVTSSGKTYFFKLIKN